MAGISLKSRAMKILGAKFAGPYPRRSRNDLAFY